MCLQPLEPEFFYSRKSEETLRICSSSIGRFFLSIMQQTLVQERRATETPEDAPTSNPCTTLRNKVGKKKIYGCFVGSMMKLFGSLGQPSRKIDHDGRR